MKYYNNGIPAFCRKRKNMLNLFLSVLFLFLTGCSKSKDNTRAGNKSGYFKMKVDGVLKEYDSCWVSGFSQTAGSAVYYQWNIKAGVPGNYAGVYVNDIVPIQAKVFQHTEINPSTNTPMAGLGAYRPAGTSDIYISVQTGWPQYEAVVEIISVDNKYVTGKFHGQVRLVGGITVLTVTDGEFRALR